MPKKYIEHCLKSLENQTLGKEHFCVYLALNGPKETFEEYIGTLLKEMTFSCVYFYLERSGVSFARNQLLEKSEERYIVFLDDDDIISDNYLENLLLVTSQKYMGISSIYEFKSDVQHLSKNYIGLSYKNLATIEESKYKTRKYFSSPCAKMLHRDMIGNIKFDTNLKNSEDGLFMAMISKNIKGTLKTNEKTAYYVFRRNESASQMKRTFFMRINLAIYLSKRYLKLFFTPCYDKIFIATRIIATLRYALK